MKTYLVGGCVRDYLLGIEPKDVDYVVVGSTPAEMRSLGFSQVGASFPVFLKNGEEYALARTERKTGVGYHGFDVDFNKNITLEEDLLRRDLTINSMAMDIDTREIIDPYGGRLDLVHGILRHTSAAFADDPVRVLRTARFVARYGFDVHPDTLALMRKVVVEINAVPRERIWAEFEKGMMEKQPHRMLETLEQCGALRTRAMLPYAGWNESLRHVTDSDDEYTRFALIAHRFHVTDYDLCKVPTHLKRVSISVNLLSEKLMQYTSLPPVDRLKLLYDLRALQDATHINRVTNAIKLWMPPETWLMTINAITLDIEIVKCVDASAIAATKPPNIASAIFDARCAVMP